MTGTLSKLQAHTFLTLGSLSFLKYATLLPARVCLSEGSGYRRFSYVCLFLSTLADYGAWV